MFSIQYIGSNFEHRGDFRVEHPRGLGSYLLLYTRTKGRFCIGGAEAVAEPGTWLLLSPSMPHLYTDFDGYYADDWIHFDSTGPVAACLTDRLIRINGIIQVDLYIRLICDAHFRGASAMVTSQMIQALLDDVQDLVADQNMPSVHIRPLLLLRKRIYAAPHLPWTVQQMAEQTMMSIPHFQVQYKKAFGVTPMSDVIESRLMLARKLLASPEMSIAEVADRCGYANCVHFTRQFHQRVGITPTAFRETVN